MIGSLPTVSIDFGTVSVSGRSRVPNPPTSTMACTAASPRSCRCPLSSLSSRVGRRPVRRCSRSARCCRRLAAGAARCCRRDAGTVSPGSRRWRVEGAELLEVGRRRRHLDVDVVGHEGDRDRQAVLVERDVVEAARVHLTRARIEVVLPHDDGQPSVLAVALGLAFLVDEGEVLGCRAAVDGEPAGGQLQAWCRRSRCRSSRRTRRAWRCARSPATRWGASGSRRRRGCAHRS